MGLFGGNCNNGDWWIWVLIIIILVSSCSDNGGFLGCGNNNCCDNDCGC